MIGEGQQNERIGIIFCAFYANRRAAYLRVDVFNIAERMMNLLNKFLCWLGWHKWKFESLMPTGRTDSWGDPTYYYQISIHKCVWCQKKRTVIHANDDPLGIFKP